MDQTTAQSVFEQGTIAHLLSLSLDRKSRQRGVGKPILGRIPARDKVFTSELRDVSQAVLEHRTKPEAVDLSFVEKLFDQPMPYSEELMQALVNVFVSTKPSTAGFDPVVKHIAEVAGAASAAFLVLDLESYTYKPTLHVGLDIVTLRNLRFSLDDAYLDPELQEQCLAFSGNLADDIHFRKRFSTDFFREHGAAVFLNLRHHTFPGYLALFFVEPPTEPLAARLLNLLADVLPAVLCLAGEADTKPHDMTERQFGLLKEFTRNGKESMERLRVRFPDVLEHASGPLVLRQICEVLLRHIWLEERIFVTRLNEIVILAAKGRPHGLDEAVHAIASRFGLRVETDTMRYPTDGANFFNYL